MFLPFYVGPKEYVELWNCLAQWRVSEHLCGSI